MCDVCQEFCCFYLQLLQYIKYTLKPILLSIKIRNIESEACKKAFFEKSVEIMKKICYTFKQVLKLHFWTKRRS